MKLANMYNHIPGFYLVYQMDDGEYRSKSSYPLASIIDIRTNLVIAKTQREMDGNTERVLDHLDGVLYVKEGYYEWNAQNEDYQKLTDEMYYQRLKGYRCDLEEFAASLCEYIQDKLSENKINATSVGWDVERNQEGISVITLLVCVGFQLYRHSFPMNLKHPKHYSIDTWGALVNDLMEGLKHAG